MKIPKIIKRHCPKCKTHTDQKVTSAKKKTVSSAHPLAKFAKARAGFGKGTGNLGKYGSKPAISKFKMAGKKTSKKTDFRYECSVCKKSTMQKKGVRTKKIEFK